MLMFSEFQRRQKEFSESKAKGGYNFNGVIMQMQTGEGKSIVIAMLAIFVRTLMKKKVHVLENNEGLLERDYETYEPYYKRFRLEGEPLKTAKGIDPDADICYCLKSDNSRFFAQQLVEGTLKKTLDDVILIVDEVDDLIINEKPYAGCIKPDVERSPEYQHVYRLVKADRALIKKKTPPDNVSPRVWKDCQRIIRVASEMEENVHYMKGVDDTGAAEYLMLEEKNGIWCKPKVKGSADWLDYLNFLHFDKEPRKHSFYAGLCTPFMYTKYSCIFGLTGSVGSEAEKKYIKETYRAVSYEVPQFLTTCEGDCLREAVNCGVELCDTTAQQLKAVVDMVKANYRRVPVLVITRKPQEIDAVHQELYEALVQDEEEPMDENHLQQLRELDNAGRSLKREWKRIIKDATARASSSVEGTDEPVTFCVVTVTDYFGGRGHDYKVMDDDIDKNGGMLVIATSVPDKREWIQWKGRTARQDKRGQFAVILSEEDAPFQEEDGKKKKDVISRFRGKNADERIEYLIEDADKCKGDMLAKFSSDQAKGAWLNELSQKYYEYKEHKRDHSEIWPTRKHLIKDKDKVLRGFLERNYKDGEQIRKLALDKLNINLEGPPAWWKYPADKPFLNEDGCVISDEVTVDLMILMDLTASMGSYIDQAKEQTRKIVVDVKKKFEDVPLKLAFVGYRDHCDPKDKQLETLDFVDAATQIDKFESFVRDRCNPYGGGDQPEDVAGGLEAATQMRWSSSVRIVAMFADAPAHGDEYHDSMGDSYPRGDPKGRDPKSLVKKLVGNMSCDFYFMRANHHTDKMVCAFREAIKTDVKPNGERLFEEYDLSNAANFVETMSGAIETSITSAPGLLV